MPTRGRAECVPHPAPETGDARTQLPQSATPRHPNPITEETSAMSHDDDDGTSLDHDDIRVELDEIIDSLGPDPDQTKKLIRLSDCEIATAVQREIDDDFLQRCRDIRSRAISALLSELGVDPAVKTAEVSDEGTEL